NPQGIGVLLRDARIGFGVMFEQIVTQKLKGNREGRANGEQDLAVADRRVPRIGNRRRHSGYSRKIVPARQTRTRLKRCETHKKYWRKGIPDWRLPNAGQ